MMLSQPFETCALGAISEADGSTRFRVWAPRADQLSLRLVDDPAVLVPMEHTSDGYYEIRVPNLGPGARYFYQINGQVDRPDPASRFQPLGVHESSEVTCRDFLWTDARWAGLPWDDYVIYELHVGTFSRAGTFAGVADQLDDLASLGITAIQLMPVAQFPGDRNWGYDGVHPYAPQNTYGRPEDLKRLIDGCHARGLAVILDVVYNHLGPEGNYLDEFGPYFSERYRTAWGAAINYDGPRSDPVRQFFVGNALYWMREFHVDGFRLDATHAIFDQSARHFLRELGEAIHACGEKLGRRVHVIAENNANDPRLVQSSAVGGYGLDAQLLDDFQRSLHALASGEREGFYADFGDARHFAKAYAEAFVLAGQYSKYRRRSWGADGSAISANRFVVYAQNHDTVGNRAASERLGGLISFEELKLVAAATLLSPSIPSLFMGEEYGDPAPFHYFTSHGDPQLAEAVRRGRQQEFAEFRWSAAPADPQALATFENCRLNRSLGDAGCRSVLRRYYRALLGLRRRVAAIRDPDRRHAQMLVLDEERTVIVHRGIEGERICICFHFGAQPLAIERNCPHLAGWRVLFNSDDPCWGTAAEDAQLPAERYPRLDPVAPKSCVMWTEHLIGEMDESR